MAKILRKEIIIAIILALITGTIYFYTQYQKSQQQLESIKKDPSKIATIETKELVEKVGKLIVLPKEIPTVATVTDVAKLKAQAFFEKAQNGDKVLIFPKAKKSIIYRESINKIIEVATVNIGQDQNSKKTVKVALYNGTKTVGLTYTVEKNLKEKIENIDIIDRDNATRDDYNSTIVIDLSGKNQDAAQKIAKELEGSVGELPETEVRPEGADILVIIAR